MLTRPAIARPVAWAVLLHVGILLSLVLMALPCNRYEQLFDTMHLPAWLNPVQCHKPVAVAGPIIQATLVGPAAAPEHDKKPPAPAPKPDKSEQQKKPEKQKTPPTPEKPPVKTLPPPPEKPALKDQQKVVERAQQPSDKAQHKQQEKQRQRPAELEVDKMLAQLDKLQQQSAELERKSKQQQQDLQKQADSEETAVQDEVPQAAEARSGGGGQASGLAAQYAAALTRTITRSWLRPDNIPDGVVCPIRITQIPGGEVINVTVLSSCPFDGAGRRSVKDAVLRAQPLPYKGFESVFQRRVTLKFKVQE